jgi:prepilin-type N-terminal cleavage/methylation domain-containing protein
MNVPIRRREQQGFTLIELMVAIAIVAILSAIAFPIYTRYIDTSEEGVLVTNIASMEIFQEDFRMRNGSYAVNLADLAAIEAAIGWRPQANDGITYSIANGDGSVYQVTATHPNGETVCVEYPSRTRC